MCEQQVVRMGFSQDAVVVVRLTGQSHCFWMCLLSIFKITWTYYSIQLHNYMDAYMDYTDWNLK